MLSIWFSILISPGKPHIGGLNNNDGIVNLDNLLSDNSKPNDISLDELDLNLDSLDIGDNNELNNDPILNINNEVKEPIVEPVKEKTYEDIQKEKPKNELSV